MQSRMEHGEELASTLEPQKDIEKTSVAQFPLPHNGDMFWPPKTTCCKICTKGKSSSTEFPEKQFKLR